MIAVTRKQLQREFELTEEALEEAMALALREMPGLAMEVQQDTLEEA